ncbi:hypothetical protein JCM10908_001582 [Rhodotorula pacifica]|uniref:TFIIIC subunit 5 family protein n=1 Tax=Rhodotorula pacifica TaxID=1495444 RepID=UPI00317E54A1
MDDLRLPTPPPILHAPKYRLAPPQHRLNLATVEYPGPVHSIQNALDSLGGVNSVAKAFTAALRNNAGDQEGGGGEEDAATAAAERVPLELNLDPNNRFSHPVQAHMTTTSNIVCRVVKRRRKKPIRDANGVIIDAGMYQIQPIAVEHRLARFRAMADYQYTPSRHAGEDSALDMAEAIEKMDIKAIRNFKMPPPSEDYPESAFLPPPTFSRHPLPSIFDMHPAPGTVRVTTDAGLTRLISAGRYKVRTVQSILHVQRQVPTEPESILLDELGRDELSPIEEKMKKLLEERPCWTRTAMLNQLSPEEHKAINANKSCWPMVSYTFADGPFRDLVIRYGYDPRADPEARFYQHIALRNLANVRTRAQPGTRAQAQAGAASSRRGDKAPTTSNLSHEFDGEHVYGKIGHFQLCDISDPLLKSLIDSPDGVLPACSSDPNEGWYAYDYLEQIRQILKRKWHGLLNGLQVSSADCEDLLGWQLSNTSRAGQAKKGPGGGGSGVKGPRRSKSRRSRANSDASASSGGAAVSSSSSSSGGRASSDQGQEEEEEDVWRSDQTSDDDDSLDSADEAARLASSSTARASRKLRRSTRGGAAATAAAGESSPAPGGAGDNDIDNNDDDDDEDEAGFDRRASTSAATPKPGPGAGPRTSTAASRKSKTGLGLAPWDKPKKKRAQAKMPETEAELFARVNRAARRNSQRQSSAAAAPAGPRIDPDTGEEMDEESS